MRISTAAVGLGFFLILGAMPATTARAQDQPPAQTQSAEKSSAFDWETGETITAATAKSLEDGLVKNPDNLSARAKLIRYYFRVSMIADLPELDEKRHPHIFWVIEHHPESDIAGSPESDFMPLGRPSNIESYLHAKELWLQEIEKHPADAKVLLNASNFFSWQRTRNSARKSCRRRWNWLPPTRKFC